MQELRGVQLGPYRLEEEISQNGAVRSYLATQTTLGRRVLVKVLSLADANDPTIVERFMRDVAAVARLRHPHIATVHDYGEEAGLLYLATEFVESGSLGDRLTGPVPFVQTYLLVSQIGSALDYAHSRGVVHRNLKPGNVLLVERSGQRKPLDANFHPWILLSDFSVGDAEDGRIGGASFGMQSPYYLSPEQALGLPADRLTDIYSLAIIAFELLTGTVPFGGNTTYEVASKQINEPLPSPRLVVPNLPAGIDRVLERAASKRPEDRYRSAVEFADDLARAGGLEPSPRDTTPFSEPATPEPRFGLRPVELPEEDEEDYEEEGGRRNLRSLIVPIAGGVGGLLVICLAVFCALNWVGPTVTAALGGTTARGPSPTAVVQGGARTPSPAAGTTPSPAAVQPSPVPTATPSDREVVQNVVRLSNQIWAEAVGRNGNTSKLATVFGGRWLDLISRQVTDLRANNQYREANLQEIRFDAVEVVGNRATVRTTERWADTLRSATGTLINTNPPVVSQTYTLEKSGATWLVVDSQVTRSGT